MGDHPSKSEAEAGDRDDQEDQEDEDEDQDHLASIGVVPRSDADHLRDLDVLGITAEDKPEEEELLDILVQLERGTKRGWEEESGTMPAVSERQEASSVQRLAEGTCWFRKTLANSGLEVLLRDAARDGDFATRMHCLIRACECHVQITDDWSYADVFATNSRVAAKAECTLSWSAFDLREATRLQDATDTAADDVEEQEQPAEIKVVWTPHKSHDSFAHRTVRPSFMSSPSPQSFRPSLRSWTFKHRLDPVQAAAIACVEQRESVLLSAPTSAGKTAVATYAVAMALHEKNRAIYTTPIKTLSNQKFMELGTTFGGQYVGIMTGDTVIASDAPIVVMTLEILQSMLYKQARDPSLLDDFAYVVIDEAHFLGDIERGYAWEEVIILLPLHIKLVLLSATVPNADTIAGWCSRVRTEPVHVITSEKRPAPWSG